METLRVRFTPKANCALSCLGEDLQLALIYNIQDAVRMAGAGRCQKLTKLRKVPGLYRIKCGDMRVFCTRFHDTLLVTDVVRRREGTYRNLR